MSVVSVTFDARRSTVEDGVKGLAMKALHIVIIYYGGTSKRNTFMLLRPVLRVDNRDLAVIAKAARMRSLV